MTMTLAQARARLKHLLDNTLLDSAEDDVAVRLVLEEIDRSELEHLAEADSLRDRTLARTVEAQKLRAALVALLKVRPTNWDDDDDPDQVAAWKLAEAAVAEGAR
jgi:hypothetical protein